MPPDEPSLRDGQARHILIVDDNIDLARGMARLLQMLGFQVEVAHDGRAGLEQARETRPDVLLLDIGLPGIDGYQLATQIRQDEHLKRAILVAISGYDSDDDKLRSMQAGFDHYLVKPVDCHDLVKLLNQSRSTAGG
jgi:CheY-like chemotaxis protein